MTIDIEQMNERFSKAESHWNKIYKEAESDIDFMCGKTQWEDGRTYDRDKLKLVINKTESECDNIINKMRDSRPAIRTSPVDEEADPETSEILNGIIRNIEHMSDAASAYDSTANYQVPAGIGWMRVNLEYIKGTFDQLPKIEAIDNFSSVYVDPDSKAVDGSDMDFAFIISDGLSEDEFYKQYPKAKAISFKDNNFADESEKQIRIAEYFFIDREEYKLYQLEDGQILDEDQKEAYELNLGESFGELSIVDERTDERCVVKWCKTNGQEILEETEWLGSFIPVVPVYGKMIFNRGKRYVSGLVRALKDPQRLLNYWESYNTETAALQPKAPYIAAEGQLENYEKDWKNANNRNFPALVYKSVDYKGHLVPPPQKQMPPQLSPVMQGQSQIAMQYMKAVTGKVYDEGQQQLGSESGKAILLKQRGSEVATFHFIDNQSKSIRQIGKILLELIPKLYDGERIVRILGEDGTEELVPINQPFVKMDGQKVPAQQGLNIDGIYKIGVGEYDVTVDVGPSYATRRQEALDMMLQLGQIDPRVMEIGGDIVIRNSDYPGAQELAERIQKVMPADVLNDEITPEQLKLEQAKQMIDALEEQMKALMAKLEDKSATEQMKQQIEAEKLKIDAFEAETKRIDVQLKNGASSQQMEDIAIAITSLNEELTDTKQALEILLDAE